jgi:2-oxoglutarate ferredoxin oxidoreductase subunit beta
VSLGVTNVSFVAQMVDWNPPLLYETIKAAHDHKGTSFVRIIQRCPVYMEQMNLDMMDDPANLLLLKHENGILVPEGVDRLFENQIEHDPMNLANAMAVAADESKMPVGLLYRNPDALCYDELSNAGLDMIDEEKLAGVNDALDSFTI